MTKKTEKAVTARPTPKSADTRARIIAGAIRTFERVGIGEVTTRRIAAEAEVRLATLHYHFAGKEALLLAVLEALNAEMTQRAAARSGRARDVEARLEQAIRASWQEIAASRERQIAQMELTLYALRTKGSEWLAQRQYEDYSAFYASLLADEEGGPDAVRTEIAQAVGRFVLCGLDGLILQFFSMQDAKRTAEGLEALIAASKHYLRQLSRGEEGPASRGISTVRVETGG